MLTLLAIFLLACRAVDVDADGDGIPGSADCDDADPAIRDGTTSYADLDGDGWGAEPGEVGCEVPAGNVLQGGDCAGEDPMVFPGAPERCNAVDDDCDGAVDEEPSDAPPWYVDADGDGFGSEPLGAACEAPAGASGAGTDCDDGDATISPLALEVCDGLDQDCDGVIDEDAADAPEWYADQDGDGYGDPESFVLACDPPEGFLADDQDCDDTSAASRPGGQEVCGGGDEDCDGWVDDDDALGTAPTWYVDVDGDGHGNPRVSWVACEVPTGFVTTSDDCNDTDVTAFPGGTELCDSVDDDCDGVIDDDAVDGTFWYLDADGDEYGDPTTGILACEEVLDRVADGSDCDDTEILINPGMTELCGAGDEDCDGLEADDDPDVADPVSWYLDTDGDGYGEDASEVIACEVVGLIDLGGDCDESDATIHPEAVDDCEDGVDADCYGGDQSCTVTGEWGLASSDRVFRAASGRYATSVATADVNGDGLHDVVAGADEYSGTSLLAGALFVTAPVPTATEIDVDVESSIHEGISASDYAGSSVAGGGDADGDGLDEVLVGAYNVAPNQSGAVYLLSGALFGTPGAWSLSDATAVFPGEHDWDAMGETVAAVGDLDADGREDWVLGAPSDYTGAYHAGSFVVVPGDTYVGTQSCADFVRVLGDSSGMHLAGSIDGAGDFDGDGLDDVIVGAEADTSTGVHAGSAFILPGPLDTPGDVSALALLELDGEDALDEAGTSVAGAGDVNGDGYQDVLVGAPRNQRAGYDTGTAYLVLGPRSGVETLTTADAILVGVTGGGLAGSAVDGAGDVDGDGYADLLIGVPHDSTLGFFSGAAYVVYGPASGTMTVADANAHLVGNGGAGGAVVGGGNFDGDGLDDLLIAAPDLGGGAAWVVFGAER